jgi:type I restriction enzyme R subunit
MLVTSSIFEACKCYELFTKTDLADKCAIVTSYRPSPADIKGEASGEGLTEKLRQYEIYNTMLNGQEPEAFEKAVKKKFIDEPGPMKLLIVVNKLLTGFDAPPATYLYLDKKMRGYALFQAICRINRLDGDDKEYGYIIDYQDLFKSLENSIHDYTAGVQDGYDKADVAGLLKDRIAKAREHLEQAWETIRALCEPVEAPKETMAYLRYFCGPDTSDKTALKEREAKRLARHLIDTYIRAEESEKISAFDDMTLIKMIVERGADAVNALPEGIRKREEAVAETIENNVRKLITDETPINPKYYEKMSELLDALIEQRRKGALDYQKYLAEVVELAKQAKSPPTDIYPSAIDTTAKRALYDNLDGNEALTNAVDDKVRKTCKDGWRGHKVKEKEVKYAVRSVLQDDELTERIFDLVKNHRDY